MAANKLVMRLARAGKCGPALRAYQRLDKNRYTDRQIGTMRRAVNRACKIGLRDGASAAAAPAPAAAPAQTKPVSGARQRRRRQ
jgi:hypothetical protein